VNFYSVILGPHLGGQIFASRQKESNGADVMAQNKLHAEHSEKSPTPGLVSAELADVGKEQIEAFGNAQAALLEEFQETNKRWLAHLQVEASLASEFATKLAAARSIPEAVTACQEWNGRQFEMMAQEGKHLLAAGVRFLSIGHRVAH
jgi:hypothetical protein